MKYNAYLHSYNGDRHLDWEESHAPVALEFHPDERYLRVIRMDGSFYEISGITRSDREDDFLAFSRPRPKPWPGRFYLTKITFVIIAT